MEKAFVLISEYILGYLLQSITCILWLAAYVNKYITLKRFMLLSLLLSIVTMIARILPITFGTHTIISIISIILIGIWQFKLDVYRSVIVGGLAFTIIMACEVLVFVSLYFVFLGSELTNTFLTTRLFHNKTPGIIANVIFFLFVTVIYIIKDSKRKRLN